MAPLRIEFTFMAAGQACADAAALANRQQQQPMQRINLGRLGEMLESQGQVMEVPR
jgi:hypothetical protein